MQTDEKIKEFCEREYASLTNNQKLPTDLKNSPSRKISSNTNTNGRWTREEHIRFVEGLSYFGKNWKLVEDYVGSRTGAQIRSHAQKFFNRLEREYNKQNQKKSQQQGSNSANQSQNSNDINKNGQKSIQYIGLNPIANQFQKQYRKRFESFDSTTSHEPYSEDITQHFEEKVSPEALQQLVHQDNAQKKDIKEWIQYYNDQQNKLLSLQADPLTNSNQNEENISKINGIIQLLSAYDSIQESAQQQFKIQQIQQQIGQEQMIQDNSHNNDFQNKIQQQQNFIQESNDQVNQTSNFQNNTNVQVFPQFSKNQTLEEQILGNNLQNQQIDETQQSLNNNMYINTLFQPMSYDPSFFSFIIQRYWNSLGQNNTLIQNDCQQNLSSSQQLSQQGLDIDINQNPYNLETHVSQFKNNENQQQTKKRKGSFALKETGDDQTMLQKKERLENFRKLLKSNQETEINRSENIDGVNNNNNNSQEELKQQNLQNDVNNQEKLETQSNPDVQSLINKVHIINSDQGQQDSNQSNQINQEQEQQSVNQQQPGNTSNNNQSFQKSKFFRKLTL